MPRHLVYPSPCSYSSSMFHSRGVSFSPSLISCSISMSQSSLHSWHNTALLRPLLQHSRQGGPPRHFVPFLRLAQGGHFTGLILYLPVEVLIQRPLLPADGVKEDEEVTLASQCCRYSEGDGEYRASEVIIDSSPSVSALGPVSSPDELDSPQQISKYVQISGGSTNPNLSAPEEFESFLFCDDIDRLACEHPS